MAQNITNQFSFYLRVILFAFVISVKREIIIFRQSAQWARVPCNALAMTVVFFRQPERLLSLRAVIYHGVAISLLFR